MTGIEEAVGVSLVTAIAGSAAASTVIIGTVTVGQVVGAAVIGAALIGLELVLAPNIPPPDQQHQSIRQAITARTAGYGYTRQGGVYLLFEAANGNSCDVLAICIGPIQFVRGYFLDEDVVTLGSSPDKGGTNWVETTPNVNDDRYLNQIQISVNMGLATETAFPNSVAAFPGIWTSNHRGDQLCTAELLCHGVKQNDLHLFYPALLPHLSLVVDHPAVWDFRDGAQDPGNPATWVSHAAYDGATTYSAGARVMYNGVVYISVAGANTNNNPQLSVGMWVSVFSNPVLQMVDYLTNTIKGLGLSRDNVIVPSLAALIVEANICDSMIAKANLDNEPLYTSNIAFQLDNDPEQIIGNIASTCDMWIAENGDGSLALKVGKYRAPTVFLNPSNILSIDVDMGQTDEQVVNHIELSFTSPTQNYKLVPAQAWEDTADIALRGVTRSNNLALPAVYSPSQARRLSKRAFVRLNSPIRGTIITTLYGLTALGERWIGLHYPEYTGLAGAVVEVQRVAPDWNSGTVSIDFLQIDPFTIDDWDAATEEGSVPANPDFVASGGLPVPQHVLATYVGSISTTIAVKVIFDDPQQTNLSYALQYRLVDDGTGNPGPWLTQLVSEVTTDGTRITLSTFTLQSTQGYVLEVASVGPTGTYSDWSTPQYLFTSDSVLVTDDGITLVTDDNIPLIAS